MNKESSISIQKRIASVFVGMLLVSLLSFGLTGCQRQEGTDAHSPSQQDLRTLRIGLVPDQDVFSQEKFYRPLFDELARELGIAIEIRVVPRYRNLIENFQALDLDGAVFGSLTGALAIQKLEVEPIARPRYEDGSSTCYGMVFVRKGEPIHSADDLKNRRLVLVDEASAAGYLLPLDYFHSLNLADLRTGFTEIYFSGTQQGAISDVISGLADVGAAKSTVLFRLARTDQRILQGLEIMATSPLFPTDTLAVRSDLDEELKQRLKQRLLAMNDTEKGREILTAMAIDCFIDTGALDFRPVLDYAAQVAPLAKALDAGQDR